MKSAILISRISRVVETEGALGEGAALAEEYAAAVRQANIRLESVQAAIDAKQVSDAVRMMEDAPRLLDEIGTLDFNQLPDWEVLCSRNSWAIPPKLDKALLERVLMLNESTEVVEPFLRMYRKAVRTNNNQLAVQSLRRLVQLDHSQNWTVNLVQAEEAVQKQMVVAFRAAKASGKMEDVDRIAQEFLDTEWSEQPTSRGIEEIRAYIFEKEAQRRNVEGSEDLAIIGRCMSENWNRQLAYSMLRAVDALVEKGFVVPESQQETLATCRKRCADEMEAAEKEIRWKELLEQLHAAIQREDAVAIRDILSAPEFIDREPDPELVRQAQMVFEHEEATRKRKVLQIAVCVMVGLFAVLGVSGWWLKQKLFNARCEGEATKLAALQKGSHAVDRLSEALARLQEQDPEVYADPRVNVFAGTLTSMRSQFVARTNEVATILAELQGLRTTQWGDSVESVTCRIERVERLITKDDGALRSEFISLKSAWADHCDEMETANRNTATKFHTTLISHINVIANRLRSELLTDDLTREVAACKDSIKEWKRVHARHVPALEGDVVEAEKNLSEAENLQRNLLLSVKKLKNATSAKDCLDARKTLLEYYSTYPFVKCIGETAVTSEDAAAIAENSSPEQKAYSGSLSAGVGDSVFKRFIADNVSALSEIPSFYSLYGLYFQGAAKEVYFAVCKGKPAFKRHSYDNGVQIDGELLDFARGEMTQQMTKKSQQYVKPVYASLEQSDEIKNLVDLAAQPNLTISKFETAVFDLIGKHLDVADKDTFLRDEDDVCETQPNWAVGRFPSIRRIQFLHMYFTWLRDDLKLMPKSGVFAQWQQKIEALAQPVRVDKVPEELSWCCMKEKRVRLRNSECARLLEQMASHGFMEDYKAWRSARLEFGKICDWKIDFAGSISYDPFNPVWIKDHSTILLSVSDTVNKDHPLYVLRRENDKLVLKRALIPCNGNSAWSVQSGMSKELLAGEPLFHIASQGKYIDAEREIQNLLKSVPKNIAEQVGSKIPFVKIEVP